MPSARGVAATNVLVRVQGVGDPEEHQQDVVGHDHEHDFILEMIIHISSLVVNTPANEATNSCPSFLSINPTTQIDFLLITPRKICNYSSHETQFIRLKHNMAINCKNCFIFSTYFYYFVCNTVNVSI